MSDQPFILRALSILDNPRVIQLPDQLWRTYMELYLHACRVECGIELPALGYMAWRLRRHAGVLLEDLRWLEQAGLVFQGEAGGWFVRGHAAGGEWETWLEAFKKP
jgi:hypothetical protein